MTTSLEKTIYFPFSFPPQVRFALWTLIIQMPKILGREAVSETWCHLDE